MNNKVTIILIASALLILLLIGALILLPKQQEAVTAMPAHHAVPTFTPTPLNPAAWNTEEAFTRETSIGAEGASTDGSGSSTDTSNYLLPTATPLPEDLARMTSQATLPASPTPEPQVTVPAIPPSVALNANLRGGPGTNYAVVGGMQAGEPLDIIAKNEAGDWYLLESSAWIAAFLVNDPPLDVPVVEVVSITP